ncbi:glycosyltransferase family 1 protein [Mesotoga sp. BH458_6_3_2_1]|uniref:glycosyltransferase family 1 protein n=1 Tax=Mesotoga sp. BH458_6_3_2_1 TaxID=1437446 RepID=UPI000EF1EED4|nr:glycosyltransferase family 1 protein [Mesotoga sp. BH458_6_3_2_1]RLL85924.1 hypothetical protein Y697_13925 [Mesotoga sp. BH458_6_3_2_1]
MIRVLHVLKGMNRGGIENFLMNVYRSIDRNAVQFDFLVHQVEKGVFDEEIVLLGGKIFRVPGRREGVLKNKKNLHNFFFEHREYGVVHQHVSSLSYIEPLKLAEKNQVKTRILHCHSTMQGGSFVHRYLHSHNKEVFLKYVTHTFTCSHDAARWVFGEQRVLEAAYKVLRYGIETSKFTFSSEARYNIRKSLGIEKNLVIGHLGRFTYPKNHLYLIEVFQLIHKRREDAVLLLIGDGELRKEIERRVVELGLKRNVIFAGSVPDPAPYLSSMDVFVFPSHYEGFPISMIEAQASGLPCVVSNEVTSEARITENVYYLSLDSPTQVWCDLIEKVSSVIERRSAYARFVKEAGFDVQHTSKWLEEFYLHES